MAETTVRELADVVGIPVDRLLAHLGESGLAAYGSRSADQRSGKGPVVHAPAPTARQGSRERAGFPPKDHTEAQVRERAQDRFAAGAQEDSDGRDAPATCIPAGRRTERGRRHAIGRGSRAMRRRAWTPRSVRCRKRRSAASRSSDETLRAEAEAREKEEALRKQREPEKKKKREPVEEPAPEPEPEAAAAPDAAPARCRCR